MKGLMLYPTLYEGEEKHPNIFYCGSVPNQQVEPVLSWAISNISNQFVLIGSDYIYPHSTNKQVKEWIQFVKGKTLCESYYPLGSHEFGSFFYKLEKFRQSNLSPVVFSTLVGTSIISFYQEYRKRNVPYPIISPITSEIEIDLMGVDAAVGHYCTSAYFQDIQNKRNAKFKQAYRKVYGEKPISREIASSYEAVYLLYEAYKTLPHRIKSKKDEAKRLLEALKTATYNGAQGKVIMNPELQQLWQWSRIGQIMPNGKIHIEWSSPGPIPPRPRMVETPLVELKSDRNNNSSFHTIIGTNGRFSDCIELAKIAAKTAANVLITGESGTGKEIFAKAIHQASSRKNFPFVPINCVTIPHHLIASELFGYEEGSFTGAKRGGKPGKFEAAMKGTLFLDEIGEMPLDLQGHLLRVLQEKEIYRIGGNKPIPINVRIIASTNRDLPQEIAYNGSFRNDLYYRLNVFSIELPPLREHLDDIPLLTEHFLTKLNSQNHCEKVFDYRVLNSFYKYTWPGNIRELENVVERSFYVAIDTDIIHAEHLPKRFKEIELINIQNNICDLKPLKQSEYLSEEVSEESKKNTKDPIIKDFENLERHNPRNLKIDGKEKELLLHAIKISGYNLSLASRLVGISRSTIYRKIKKYKIDMNPDWIIEKGGKKTHR
jgi:DNA-binding NtrC family response regulator/ABC-type branched-subunit amino acid transport system substrate-binding protein